MIGLKNQQLTPNSLHIFICLPCYCIVMTAMICMWYTWYTYMTICTIKNFINEYELKRKHPYPIWSFWYAVLGTPALYAKCHTFKSQPQRLTILRHDIISFSPSRQTRHDSFLPHHFHLEIHSHPSLNAT